MISKDLVENKIAELLRNEVSPEQFENWLASASRNIHVNSSPEAIELVSSIHRLLSERDDHLLNEVRFLDALRSLARSVTCVSILAGEPAISYFVTRSSSRRSPLVLSSAQA